MIEEPRDAVLEEFGYSTWDVQRVDVSVFLKEPHPGQLRVKRSQAKFKVVKAGRRGGKTTGAAGLAVEGFLEGRRVLYGVPVSDQLERFWTECQIALADALRKKVYLLNQTMHLICKSELDHARIRAKTAWNADTLRGDEADLLILDEWQLMDEEAWTRVGAPMLIDKNGDAIFIYTPPSLASKSVSKARDKKHASKLFKDAQQHFENRSKAGKIPDWETFHWRSMDNPHLSREGLAQVSENLTSLAYRQEIMAEDVDEAPGALWKRSWLEANRVRSHPDLIRVVTAIDPPGGATECGIVTAGIGYCFCKGGKEPEIHGFVLEDASTKVGDGPEIWAPEALRSQRDHEGDKIVAEVNYGGDMVDHTIKVYDPRANVQMVHATRGKAVRAEPVSALDEKGKIHHVGAFPDMEDELCEWIPGQTGHSPNRLDARVWALTDLMVQSDYSPLSQGMMVGTPRNQEFLPPQVWPSQF